MNVEIVVNPLMEHHAVYAAAMREGLRRHGVAVTVRTPDALREADVSIAWGWRLAGPLCGAGSRVLVMERGYIGDRMRWTSLGWNGLNGRATFPAVDNAAHRLAWHFPGVIRPVNMRGEYVLLIGQVEGDAALGDLDVRRWYAETTARAAELFGLPVKFRPHPLGDSKPVTGAETLEGDLAAALDGAALVVTWNSTVGVESVLRGKPTVAMDAGSMALPVADTDLRINVPLGRDAWASRLAWCQWSIEEIRNGYAWDVVRGGAQ